METRKTKIIAIVALVGLTLMVVASTYAYFQAQTGDPAAVDVSVTANTVDTFTFSVGNAISISLDQDNFAAGTGNQIGSTTASAKLTANNKTNTATEHYNLYLNISDNSFTYSNSDTYPEILLILKDANNNAITSVSGLEYKTITDGNGDSISGFDITNKIGLTNLLNNREITTTSTTTDTWNITVMFVNYNFDQSKNAGQSFNGQVVVSKDVIEDYIPNTITSLNTTQSGTNLTVNLNVDSGTNEIDKYYYAIEETDAIAYIPNNNTLKVSRVASILAENTLTYKESSSTSYTFSNLKDNTYYRLIIKVMDTNGKYSNIYIKDVKVPLSFTFANYIIAQYTGVQGANGLYHHDGSIKATSDISADSNGILFVSELSAGTVLDANDGSYRYAGGEYVLTPKAKDLTAKDLYIGTYFGWNTGFAGVVGEYCSDGSLISQTSCDTADYYALEYDANTHYTTLDEAITRAVNDGYATSLKNYVCISNEETCSDDNLFRIIGVFDGKVKLIKATSIGNYAWDTNGSNIWSTSTLNAYLNGEYLISLGDFASKIAKTAWIVGGHSDGGTYSESSLSQFIPNIVYSNEITNPNAGSYSTETTYDAKIGLMYVSDYLFAAGQSAWVMSCLAGENTGYKRADDFNWLPDYNEWTITRSADCSYKSSYSLYDFTSTNFTSVDSQYKTRPSFYLTSGVTYSGGTGTASDPFRLGV